MSLHRVLLVCATSGGSWGGMERHVRDLAESLVALGQSVSVLVDPAYAHRFPEGVTVLTMPCHRSRWSWRLAWVIRRALVQVSPTVVHTHGNKATRLLSWHARYLRCRHIAWVATVHGTKSHHDAYQRCDRVVAVSTAIAQSLPHPQVTVVRNGVTPHLVSDATREIGCYAHDVGNDLKVVAVGRLVSVKGFDQLIAAWPAEASAQLWILGDGPERAMLTAQIAARGLTHRIHLMGHQSNIPTWLAAADLMVISSRREGFPYVLVEALHAGCPVLSTAVSGVSEILPPEALCIPDDPEALARLLQQAFALGKALPTRLRMQQQGAFAHARSELTQIAMAEKILAVYSSMDAL